ncbi:P-loop containing nucleoside triphosphate hydrolase protein [Obelidium mucronatum]|nr:P-loop containing nucleoside triphosphate hydrolase protein [Obelidium mucronatum]
MLSENNNNNISVSVRVRPLLKTEQPQASESYTADSLRSVIRILDENVLVFDPSTSSSSSGNRLYSHGAKRNKEQRFAFDRVFAEEASQQSVFEATTQPLVSLVLDGFNATVFAYGATGCGKTHTITGSNADPGIIYRTMQSLFTKRDEITNNSPSTQISITVSYLEVYNETIRDLLIPSCSNGSTSKAQQSLDLREEDELKRVSVAGLSEHTPENVHDVISLMDLGNLNRVRAPTEANAVSSRSHAVLQVVVKRIDGIKPAGMGVSDDGIVKETRRTATLSIIDLAGSERASVTKNQGKRLLEGANINRSLLALGNCINALCSDKPNHIPYRDSKLTRLLKYSLGGNCKVVMITNISPSSLHYEETHNTLKYANRAKNIQTKVEQNAVDVELHISQYPKIIAGLRREIELLKGQLEVRPPLGLICDTSHREGSVLPQPSSNAPSQTRQESTDALFEKELQLLYQKEQNQQEAPRQPASSSNRPKSEFQQLQIYNQIVSKMSTVTAKLTTAQDNLLTSESHVTRNETRMELLTSVAETIQSMCYHEPMMERCGHTPSRQDFLSKVHDAVAGAIDKLHIENVRLRHNATEYESAIERYKKRVQDLVGPEGKGMSDLSLIYKEKLEAAMAGIEEQSLNSRNRKLVQLLKEEVESVGIGFHLVCKSALSGLWASGGNDAEENKLTNIEKFLQNAFGIAFDVKNVHSGTPLEDAMDTSQEDLSWAVDEDSVSECDVSLAYDCVSETESECGGDLGDEAACGNMENLLDEMEDDQAFMKAFECEGGFALPSNGVCVNSSFMEVAQTPMKLAPQGPEVDDEPEDEPTPMAKAVRRESFAIEPPEFCVASAKRNAGRMSSVSSLNTTPVALLRTRVLDMESTGEPRKLLFLGTPQGKVAMEAESVASPIAPLVTRLRSAQQLSKLPVMKPKTPTKTKLESTLLTTPTIIPSAIPVMSGSGSVCGSGLRTLGVATRSVRKQGVIRASTPLVTVATYKKGGAGSVTQTPAVPAASSTSRVLRSSVHQSNASTASKRVPVSTVKAAGSVTATGSAHGSNQPVRQKRPRVGSEHAEPKGVSAASGGGSALQKTKRRG